jgi:hypothetical protein
MTTLINLIGGQTVPNLIAQKYINPDNILLLYTKGSIKQKDCYKSVSPHITFSECEIDPYNFDQIQKVISDFIDSNSSDNIILNFTGGTKIMSLASFEVFKKLNYPSIYVDSENGNIYNYYHNKCLTDKIDVKISTEEYLKLNNHIYKIDPPKNIEQSRVEYYEYLENNFTPNLLKFLSLINSTYKSNNKKSFSNNTIIQDGPFFYSWSQESSSSKIIIDNKEFIISGKDSMYYITGLWFEDLVYNKKFLNNNLYDEINRNIHIKDKAGKKDMIEIDIVALHKNNLHLFELKSGRVAREHLNNLRTIKEQLGTYTKLFIISFFELDDPNVLNDRMRDLNIQFFKYSDFSLDKCFGKININL